MRMRSQASMWRPVLIAGALLLAAFAGVLVYRYTQGVSKTLPADASDTISLGGQRFVRWSPPKALPTLNFVDQDGRPQTRDMFRGRVVLLNVWATWCGPCRKEMPTLDRLQAKLGSANFEVVALSIDNDGIPVVREFYRDTGVRHLRIYNDPTLDVTTQLNIAGVPTTLLIDRDGREIGRALGPAKWDGPDVVEAIRRQVDAAGKP